MTQTSYIFAKVNAKAHRILTQAVDIGGLAHLLWLFGGRATYATIRRSLSSFAQRL